MKNQVRTLLGAGITLGVLIVAPLAASAQEYFYSTYSEPNTYYLESNMPAPACTTRVIERTDPVVLERPAVVDERPVVVRTSSPHHLLHIGIPFARLNIF